MNPLHTVRAKSPRLDHTRRRLLGFAPASLLAATPWALVACGGGGGSGGDASSSTTTTFEPPAVAPPNFRTSAAAVAVRLPAGSGIDLTKAQLLSGTGSSGIAADGSAGTVLIEDLPQMNCLIDADGRLLLMGLIDAAHPTLDSRSTAEALIYLGAEVNQLDLAWQLALREALRTHPVVEPLRLAVEAALGRGGVSEADPALVGALGSALSVIRRKPAAATLAAEARSHALSVTVTPDTVVSGLQVSKGVPFDSVVVTNRFRRRAWAYVDQVSYLDKANVLQTLPQPVPLTNFEISATTAASFDNLVIRVGDILVGLAQDIGLIADQQTSSLPFTRETSDPVFLPLSPADQAAASIYRLRVIGIGAIPAVNEADLDFARSRLDQLRADTLWFDFLVPLMKTLVLPAISTGINAKLSDTISKVFSSTLVDAVDVVFLTTVFPKTMDAVKTGDAARVWDALWPEFFTSSTWQEILKQSLVALNYFVRQTNNGLLLLDSSGKVLWSARPFNPEIAVTEAETLSSRLGRVALFITAAKAAATLVDYGAIIKDWTSSSVLSTFELSARAATLAFTPAALALAPGQFAPLGVAIADGATPAGSTLTYKWTLSGTAGGQLRNPRNGVTGRQIDTSEPNVTYVAAPGASNGSTDSIGCSAVLTDIGTQTGGLFAVALVPATVTIDDAIQLTPATLEFAARETAAKTLTVRYLKGTGDGLLYEWTCPSALGILSDGLQSTSSTSTTMRTAQAGVSYVPTKALTVGTEIVSVRVFRVTSAPDAVTETTETVRVLQAIVTFKALLSVRLSPPGPLTVPTDIDIGLTASFNEPLPFGSIVSWSWRQAGVGTLAAGASDAASGTGTATFTSGATDGSATVTAQATIDVPSNSPGAGIHMVTDAVSVTLAVQKGLTSFSLKGGWMTVTTYTPFLCGNCGPFGTPLTLVGWSMTAYAVVPKVSRAKGYVVVLNKATPDVPGGITFPNPRDLSPPTTLGSWEAHGGTYWSGLSTASGSSGGDDGSGPAPYAAWFQGRFGDLSVDVTVSL